MAPCIWIINPQETTYVLKSILRLAGVSARLPSDIDTGNESDTSAGSAIGEEREHTDTAINFAEIERRTKAAQMMDVYTGEMLNQT